MFHLQSTVPATEPSSDVPTGFSASNYQLDYWSSFYWDKAAMATAPGDHGAADRAQPCGVTNRREDRSRRIS